MKTFLDRLGKEWLFCDGATGTMLQDMGLASGELPEIWNLTHPDEVQSYMEAYLKAGSTIINTNTFGLNRIKFGKDTQRIAKKAVEIAKAARDAINPDAFVALDIGPTGKLLAPMGDLAFEEAVSIFGEVIQAGAQAGADLVLIETMNDSYESKAAVLAAKENCDLPVCITNTYDESGTLMTGATVESMVAMLEGLGVDALGVNCGVGPIQMKGVIQRLIDASSLPIIVNPNAGLPSQIHGRTVYDLKAEMFASTMAEIADMGVQVMGGCCGTTPEYIERMIHMVKQKPFQTNTKKNRSVISSGSQVVEIGPKPVIIGERINPTGKKRFKQALRDRDINYILGVGLKQEEDGAMVLDVNVGLPDIDEPRMMCEVMTNLQSITSLPLQIDTSDPIALEKALRLYNGKPMINSVNGKQENMDVIFPLVKKYGGVIVGLCLDEQGIPETAQDRYEVAQKIVNTAATYGIEKKDIVLDALAMTISSNTASAKITLDTIRMITEQLHCHSILGVSNISFGLPHREIINSHFLTMAINNGLSCAIINPGNESMMRAYRASCALLNMDPQCMDYISTYADVPDEKIETIHSAKKTKQNVEETLSSAVQHGLVEQAKILCEKEIQTKNGLDIIDQELIPALDIVGQGFEKKTIFLPQLLMSADAAKAAFEVIKQSMADTPQKIKGRIILATVKGDIHDIGKNIVKVMLENYGYQVIDLGKDVDPEVIVDTAIKENISLVGLSALMTTTVVSMEQTIQLLHEKKPDTKVMVGGAVMTQEYADAIGADYYGKDAMESVRYANSLFG
ncbi:homocysteine S-methyltransferase family protein [Absicoccus porci]|uniref:homocysteine S-methyltransferase family protein n=1 Tax=Absicoccus porci TaxID=2486576 RepID=UPI003F8A8709